MGGWNKVLCFALLHEMGSEKQRGSNGCNPVKRAGPVSVDHVLLALRETREERELRIRSLFNFFDKANVGYLDCAQIEAGLSALQIPSEYKYAKDLLNVCDANKDGRVDYQEFKRYMDDKELELYRIFQAIDVEHNGCILPEELWDALVRSGMSTIHFTTQIFFYDSVISPVQNSLFHRISYTKLSFLVVRWCCCFSIASLHYP